MVYRIQRRLLNAMNPIQKRRVVDGDLHKRLVLKLLHRLFEWIPSEQMDANAILVVHLITYKQVK